MPGSSSSINVNLESILFRDEIELSLTKNIIISCPHVSSDVEKFFD